MDEGMVSIITDDVLAAAIANLPENFSSTPSLWTGVATDSRYTDIHRARCVGALFARHVDVGMKLCVVREILNDLVNSDLVSFGVIEGFSSGPILVRFRNDTSIAYLTISQGQSLPLAGC